MTVVIRTKENTTSFFFLSTLQRFHLQCNKVALFPFYCFSAFFLVKKKKRKSPFDQEEKKHDGNNVSNGITNNQKILELEVSASAKHAPNLEGNTRQQKKKTVSFPQGRGEGDEQESSAETPLVT